MLAPFPVNSNSFNIKATITGEIPADCNTKDVKVAVPLKYLINFWRILEMLLFNCEINLILFLCSSCNFINSR